MGDHLIKFLHPGRQGRVSNTPEATLSRMSKGNAMADEALIVVDLQNDFCPGGALAVTGGDEIVPLVNDLIRNAEHVVMTQDWHPAGHSSFASSHTGKQPFEMIEMPYGPQTLWPDHCIQGSLGSDFHSGLAWSKAELIIRKDDVPETIKNRLNVYHKQTEPIKKFYEAKGILAVAKGCDSLEDTTANVAKALGIEA